MRALMITDRPFGARERVMLARLETGLLSEGVRLTRAVPASAPPDPTRASLAPLIRYEDRGLTWTAAVRAQWLVEALGAPATPGERVIDVVHAFGEACWRVAGHAAQRLSAALALEVWSPASLIEAERAMRESAPGPVHAKSPTTYPRVCMTPDEPMRDLAARSIPWAPARLAPWGSPAPVGEARDFTKKWAEGAISVFVVGSGVDERACAAALQGLAGACKGDERIVGFVDAAIVRRRRGLWRILRNAGALDRVSVVEGLEARRDLTLEGDILLQPEARGEHRTITLDAFSHGALVIARRDADVQWLADGSPAMLLDRGEPRAWEQAIRGALANPAIATERVAAGREFVDKARRASAHVRSALDAYEWMAGSSSLAFSDADGAIPR